MIFISIIFSLLSTSESIRLQSLVRNPIDDLAKQTQKTESRIQKWQQHKAKNLQKQQQKQNANPDDHSSKDESVGSDLAELRAQIKRNGNIDLELLKRAISPFIEDLVKNIRTDCVDIDAGVGDQSMAEEIVCTKRLRLFLRNSFVAIEPDAPAPTTSVSATTIPVEKDPTTSTQFISLEESSPNEVDLLAARTKELAQVKIRQNK